MEEDVYKTCVGISEGLYKEKGSKFISFLYPVNSEEQIKDIIKEIKTKYYDARHRCFAYMLGSERLDYRHYDDGEPSSTAGKPILGQILSNELTDILIVVIRYFGGVKLGVPGLINAYKTAAASAISNNHIVEKTVDKSIKVTFNYPEMNNVMKVVKDMNVDVVERRFEISCEMTLSTRQLNFEQLCKRLQTIPFLILKKL